MASEAIKVGIDLGTTYSCLAFTDETGTPVMAKNKFDETNTPTIVHFPEGKPHSESEVGKIAREAAIMEPERTVQLFKPRMGKEGAVVRTIDGKDITPTEASAHVLRKMTRDFKEIYGMDIEGCVITVPAHFGLLECEATIRAGEGAGLDVIGTIQEPVAAAIYYGAYQSNEDSDVLVYDLGGGTFDVTAISIKHRDGKHDIDCVCAEGNHDLGGRLWDNKIVAFLQEEYCKATGFDGEFTPFSKQQLRTAAEDAKKHLSEADEKLVTLVLDKGPAQVKLTREMFDDLTSNLLSNTISLTRKAIEIAGDKGCHVKEILLVGGSTLMPQVRAALEKNFPDMPIQRTNPSEAVAKGAVIYAGTIKKQQPMPNPEPGKERLYIDVDGQFRLNKVTSKSYGIKVRKKDGSGSEIYNMIRKNEKIFPDQPLVVEEGFQTSEDYAANVNLQVYESDNDAETIPMEDGDLVVSDKLDIREFRLKKGAPIDVTFTLDFNGLLHIHGVEPASGRDVDFEKEITGLQSVDELQDAVIGEIERKQ